jgi:TonB-dependent starch-binding outer membrane protein SusC
MKYTFIILMGLLMLASATYAEGNDNASQMLITQAGELTVRGKVIDESGEPIPGATVIQQGTSQGTITDIDGNFTLSVPQMLCYLYLL